MNVAIRVQKKTYCPRQMQTTDHMFLNMFSDLIIFFYLPGYERVLSWERSRIPYHSALLGRWFSFLYVGYVRPVEIFAMIAKNKIMLKPKATHTCFAAYSWFLAQIQVHSFDKTSCLLDLIQCDMCFFDKTSANKNDHHLFFWQVHHI